MANEWGRRSCLTGRLLWRFARHVELFMCLVQEDPASEDDFWWHYLNVPFSYCYDISDLTYWPTRSKTKTSSVRDKFKDWKCYLEGLDLHKDWRVLYYYDDLLVYWLLMLSASNWLMRENWWWQFLDKD